MKEQYLEGHFNKFHESSTKLVQSTNECELKLKQHRL